MAQKALPYAFGRRPLPLLAGAQHPDPTPTPTPAPRPTPTPTPTPVEPESFSREYVEELRRENANYRTRSTDRDTLAEEVAKLKAEKLSEAERERVRAETAEAKLAQTQADLLRARVGKDLPPELAELLKGSTEEEMKAHADQLAKLVTPTPTPTPEPTPTPTPTPGADLPKIPRGTQPPTPGEMTAKESNDLLATDPNAWADKFHKGEIPASALVPTP